MSLTVYLSTPTELRTKPAEIYIRECGTTRLISRSEWDAKFPGTTPLVLEDEHGSTEVFSSNITHNLGRMAKECEIYEHLWRPEEIGITRARELIGALGQGLTKLLADPKHYSSFNSPNGWGVYEHFVSFVKNYLEACIENPDAEVRVSR